MSMPQDPDATMPVPGGAGGYPGNADATQPVTRPQYGGPSGPGDEPPDGGMWDDDEGDRRRLWMIAGGVLIAGVLVGGLVALASGGGGDKKERASTTTSSSTSSTSTSTSTSTTTSTTTAAGPQILQFSANPNPVTCSSPGTVNLNLTWATQNTTGVTISIDGPGAYGNYQSTGNTQVPFTCPAGQHTYLLTANGTNGQTVQQQINVQGVVPPSTTTTT